MHAMLQRGALSLEQLLEVIEQVPVGICVVEVPSLRIVAANGELASLIGVGDAASLIGTGPPAEGAVLRHLLPIWENVLRTGEASGRTTMELDGGKRRCIEVECRPLQTPEGAVSALVTAARDVTEQRRVERELRDSERRHRTIFEDNPHPMWIFDRETLRFLAVNDAAVHLYGYSRDEFLAMTIKDIRPPEDVPALLDNVSRAAEGLDLAGIWRHCTKHDTLLFMEITSHSISFGGRRAQVVLAHDVSERQKAEDDLRRSTSELNAIFAALPDLYFHVAADGTILDYRAGKATDLYVPPEEFLGKRMQDVLPPRAASAIDDGLRQALEGRCLSTVEYPLDMHGEERVFEARMVPFLDGEGIIVVRDVTDRKRAQEQLAAAYQRVIEAETERKHFYREVIRAVTNDKLRLVDAAEIPAEGEPALELPLDGAQNYSRLRRELADIARDAGMAGEDASDLVLSAGEAATNAVKHAMQGTCRVSVTPDRVVVRVSDCGTGIRPEDLPGAVLLPGFSTRISLGMGYTIMLRLVDRVWLATGHDGTVVQLEKWIHPTEQPEPHLAAAWERL